MTMSSMINVASLKTTEGEGERISLSLDRAKVFWESRFDPSVNEPIKRSIRFFRVLPEHVSDI